MYLFTFIIEFTDGHKDVFECNALTQYDAWHQFNMSTEYTSKDIESVTMSYRCNF